MENVTHMRMQSKMVWHALCEVAESLIRTQITYIDRKPHVQCPHKHSNKTRTNNHVCVHKTRFHIQLDYYLWHFLRGYDLVVLVVCTVQCSRTIQNARIPKFQCTPFPCVYISLFSHKFSATSKIVPFSVFYGLFKPWADVLETTPTPIQNCILQFVWRNNRVMNLSMWQ